MNEQYQAYLQTDAWKVKAAARMKIDGYRCQGCGCSGTQDNVLQVHHLGYRNLGSENIYRDLVTVCRSCHALLHNVMNRVTNEEGRRGWNDAPGVPKVNTYTLSGLDRGHREEDGLDEG